MPWNIFASCSCLTWQWKGTNGKTSHFSPPENLWKGSQLWQKWSICKQLLGKSYIWDELKCIYTLILVNFVQRLKLIILYLYLSLSRSHRERERERATMLSNFRCSKCVLKCTPCSKKAKKKKPKKFTKRNPPKQQMPKLPFSTFNEAFQHSKSPGTKARTKPACKRWIYENFTWTRHGQLSFQSKTDKNKK